LTAPLDCFSPVPHSVELDRLGDEFVADGFQALDQRTPFARKPRAPVCRLNQKFLGLQHDFSVRGLSGDMHKIS
jgi:hypothetical protein